MDTELEALQFAKRSIEEGACGVVYGRNVFQAENPEAFLQALIQVVREGKNPKRYIKRISFKTLLFTFYLKSSVRSSQLQIP